MNILKLAAIRYAKFGFKVFPCAVRSKIPIINGGFRSATSDLDQIESWWNKYPHANVGIVIPDDILVVDVEDSENDFLKKAVIDLLPDTVTVATPRGPYARHYWFKIKPGSVRSRGIHKLPYLDLLINGYVMGPPSIHPSGGSYRWVKSPIGTDIAEAPEWLIDLANSGDSISNEEHKLLDTESILNGIPEGNRQNALFRFACSLRGRDVRESEALELLEIAASRANPPFTEQKMSDMVRRVYSKYPPNAKEEGSRKIWTLRELIDTSLEEPQWYVERILPQGYTHFPSDPKLGKSMICANLALAVTRGTKVFGEFKTQKSGVLYMNLEQAEESDKERWIKILGHGDIPDNLHVVYSWDRMDDGGLNNIRNFLNTHENVKVIIIDVLAGFEPIKPLVEGTAYKKDYATISAISKLAREYKVSIIGVHHNSKDSTNTDFIKRGSGSMGYTAASDVIWSLERERGSNISTLSVTGKNLKDSKIRLVSTNEGHNWFAV